MKIAFLTESPADAAALRIITAAVLGRAVERPAGDPPLQVSGWPHVRDVLPVAVKHLHYRTDADALVVVADNNCDTIHVQAHEEPGASLARCRLCQMRTIVQAEVAALRPVSGRARLLAAIGVAVPAVEAWYMTGLDPHLGEAAWVRRKTAADCLKEKRRLKRAVYGTERPSLALEMTCAVKQADRLSKMIEDLQKLFPGGFGALARDLRGW